MDTSILNPDGQVLLSNRTSATVKQLTWKKTFEFLDMLRAQAKLLFNEKGEFKPDVNKVMDAVMENKPVIEWLVSQSTGKAVEELENLSLSDMTALASKALELNLFAIASEIKNVKGRWAALNAPGETSDKSKQTS